MKKLHLILLFIATAMTVQAQTDSTTFKAQLYNEQLDVEMTINLYDADVEVPNLEFLGPLGGYLSKRRSYSTCWIITDAVLKNNHSAQIEMINESGSEDLTATLVCTSDSTYTFKQGSGSTLKIPKGNKWQKLPACFTLKRKK